MPSFRRRLLMNVEKKYTPVEYIESTGTQYIDTNFKGNQDTKITCESVISDEFKSGYYQGLFGATTNNGSKELNRNVVHMHRASDSNLVILAAYGDQVVVSSGYRGNINQKHTYKLEKNVFKVDDNIIYSYNYKNFKCDKTLNIFRDNNSNIQNKRYINMKLYSTKIYDNGVLIRDYIPVLDSSSRPCLYDKVEGKFYYNQGTGEFLYE